ncbi:MAG: hypothetical protein ACLFP6_02435 [Spirochaetaceae bacterium]
MKLHITLLSLLILALSSCGNRGIGHGVILWAPEDSPLANGRLVEVTSESELNSTYTVTTPSLEEPVTLPMWRIAFFEEEDAALAYASEYAPYAETYARSLRQALPVRAERDRLSRGVYRLRENELMKVLTRDEEIADEGGLQGYWYRVLTREGIEGWAFGFFLEIIGTGGEDEEEEGPSEEESDRERILSNTWRPEYFREMINENRIDLSRFRPNFGLFPDPEAQEIRIVLPEHTVTFPYEELFSSGPSSYSLEGSPVTISLRSDSRISVQYTLNGREQSEVFLLFEEEIAEIVEEELDRREELRQRLREPGNVLTSTAYGTIELEEGERFTWTGYDRLTPTVIPGRAGESGTVSFPLFLSDDLREEYDGAILFTFTGEGERVEVRFTYEYSEGGIRLTYVPSEDVSENIVQREAFSPIVIFFTYETN